MTGSYQILEGQRVRMTLVENGRTLGSFEQKYLIESEGTILNLTLPDGSTTTYQRVR
jgi:hypothetical protein